MAVTFAAAGTLNVKNTKYLGCGTPAGETNKITAGVGGAIYINMGTVTPTFTWYEVSFGDVDGTTVNTVKGKYLGAVIGTTRPATLDMTYW